MVCRHPSQSRRRGAAAAEFAVLAPFLAFVFVIGVDAARVFRVHAHAGLDPGRPTELALTADETAELAQAITATGGTLSDATASGAITFTAQPAWTLAATPSPTSFTNSGQNISYSFKVKNTGNVPITAYAVTGTKIGTVSCPAGPLPIGAEATCTSTYTTLVAEANDPSPAQVATQIAASHPGGCSTHVNHWLTIRA